MSKGADWAPQECPIAAAQASLSGAPVRLETETPKVLAFGVSVKSPANGFSRLHFTDVQ